MALWLFAAIQSNAQYSEQDLIQEADALFDEGSFAEAMPLYSQLLSLNPTNPVFNYKYGATALYGDAEKKEEAVKYLKFAVGKPNVDDQSYYYLGRAYHLNYLFQDAITAYEKYKSLASKSDMEEKEVDLKISMAQSGQNLLSQIKEITVLDKKRSPAESFFRIYDLTDIGGKILVTPEELLSSEDKKRNHRSLIHFRGSGTTIYFSSYGKSGKTGLDIYHANVLPDGSFTEPVPVQGPINTPYDEDFPYLHPDDKTFYFSSKGHGSMGGYDVYKAAFDKSAGVFSKPINLDFAVNTPDDDLFYLADSLNEMAFFASARSSQQGNLDVYKVLVKSAPLDITLIKGTFINQIDPSKKLAKITTIDATTNKEVDVQYTDPATGEYVLSFPKGGKYKFLVEEKSSDKIHAGLVDVPTSAGVNAYLQEMELISSVGVEKLLINNLFDQTYEGDVMALAQKMLRQRAALDVNFDPSAVPEVPDTEVVDKDPAMAFSDAGFGAGMSNEKILEQAEARVEELKDRYILASQLSEGAARSAESYYADAVDKSESAINSVKEATAESGNRNASMYEAGLAKLQAENALRRANNSKNLKDELYQKALTAEKAYDAEKARVDSLREAIDSNDYDAIYAGLTLEQEIRESIDKVEDRFDPVKEVRRKGLKANTEAQKLLERAQSLRDQEEQLSASLVTKRTQQKKLKGKDLKAIEEEIAVLESDIESAKRKTERAFKQAEDAQVLADNKVQEYEILQGIADANDPAAIPSEGAPKVSWSDSEQKLLAESLNELPIDNDAVAQYTTQHPEVFESMGSEALAMEFRRTFNGAEEAESDLNEELAMNADEPVAAGQESKESGVSDDVVPENSEENAAFAENSTDQGVDEPGEGAEESTQTAKQNGEGSISTGAVGTVAVGAGELADSNKDKGEGSQEQSRTDFAIEYDESLPVEKRIEAEELKIQAAEDWVAIIDESIEQLENGMGGEEGVEEQLADYRKLRGQKSKEIEARQSLISEWEEEKSNQPVAEAINRAVADVDTLSPSLVARLEAKIPEYSTKVESIRSVSSISRNYLPALAEIEISGLSAPEMAEKRIELNEAFIADIDQILTEGIESAVSEDDLVEMRRVKTLEIQQDEAIMEGSESFYPRSAEAQSYAELIKDEQGSDTDNLMKAEPEYTELSPALAESLNKEYTKETILPDYSALMEEAELTTNPQVAEAQKLKINEDYLRKLQSEISFYKAAIDAAEKPDPQLVERYSLFLRERSEMIDEVNKGKDALTAANMADAMVEEMVAADSLISAIRETTLAGAESAEVSIKRESIEEADKLIGNTIDEYIAILDDPTANVNRDKVQVEIQKLQTLQAELAAEQAKIELAEAENDNQEEDQTEEEPDQTADTDVAKVDTNSSIDPTIASSEIAGNEIADLTVEGLVDNTENATDRSDSKSTVSGEATITEAPQISDAQQKEFESILSISEGFVIDFDRKVNVVMEESDIEERELRALADLNSSFVESIDVKIDSLNAIKTLGGEQFQRTIEVEIEELQALSADKQQEYDRLSAEAELLAMERDDTVADVVPLTSAQEGNEEDLGNIPDLSAIQYKSLNASIIRNGLKAKTDTLRQLQAQYEELNSEEERKSVMVEMDRINGDLERGIAQSNLAEINFYQSENKRLLSQLDPETSTNREEIAELQERTTELKNQVVKLESSQSIEEQKAMIEELANMNSALTTYADLSSDAVVEEGEELDEFSASILEPESHETLPNKAYLTKMQAKVTDNMSFEHRNELIENEEDLRVQLDFATGNSVEEKSALISKNTRVDAIGLDLLAETPEQLNYLVAMIRADSLKTLEKQSAAYADLRKTEAIERSAEADRLLKLIPNQETDRDRVNVEARAKKLEEEAQILYEKSALAATQAELIRAKRSQNDEKLIALSTELSFKQRRALDDLLLKPVYRIIPNEEPIAEVVEEEGVTVKSTASPDKENVAISESEVDEVALNEKPTTPELKNEGLDAVKGNWLDMVEIIAEKDDFSDVEESMFVETDTEIYDETTPIPIDPVMPEGLIFQVQVGAYRNPIPQDLFGPYAPIMGQKLDNGITRYRAGLFKKYAEALQARNEIRTKGYSDAFVVVYVNGEKLTGEQAREILAQARDSEKVSVELIKGIPSGEPIADRADDKVLVPNTDYYNDPEAAEAEQVEVISGLFYTVQVGVYSKPVKLGQLFNLTELNSELTASGVIRYTSGRFGDLANAGVRKEAAREKGVTDAFITAYFDGKRISLAEAEKLIAEQGKEVFADRVKSTDSTTEAPAKSDSAELEVSDESYVVIMGTFVDNVPQELADLFLENKSWGIRKIEGPGKAAIYLSEDIDTLEEARALLKECEKLNIKTATLGTIKDGKITSVQIE